MSTSRGRLLLGERGLDYWTEDGPGKTPSLTQPLDDILGLAAQELQDDDDDGPLLIDYTPYGNHLMNYGRFWPIPWEQGTKPSLEDAVKAGAAHRAAWREFEKRDKPRFLKALPRAADGRFPSALALDLERVRYTPDGAEVPDGDLPALAAWSLAEALRRQRVVLATCPKCNRPWVAQDGQEYCERPAPGHSRNCREVAKEERFLSSPDVRAYRREYKRLHELSRRGTLSTADLNAWRQANTPSKWAPYTTWLESTPKKKGK